MGPFIIYVEIIYSLSTETFYLQETRRHLLFSFNKEFFWKQDVVLGMVIDFRYVLIYLKSCFLRHYKMLDFYIFWYKFQLDTRVYGKGS